MNIVKYNPIMYNTCVSEVALYTRKWYVVHATSDSRDLPTDIAYGEDAGEYRHAFLLKFPAATMTGIPAK